MKQAILLFLVLSVSQLLSAQDKPVINIGMSRLYATYELVKNLSKQQPDNLYKKLFALSKYHTPEYAELIKTMDSLQLQETYEFQGYPLGQKTPGLTIGFIERNLITSSTADEFKLKTFGIIPNDNLVKLANIVAAFLPVYDSLVYYPNKQQFDEKFKQLISFVNTANIGTYFAAGLRFYNTVWDFSIPFEITIVPSLNDNGFSAKAFLNNAVTEVPISFNDYGTLFSILTHEIYHIQYDGQSLAHKLLIQKWFNENPSENTPYAYLLFNEAMATALGNGYVYEQLNGRTDSSDWYNDRYINLMARQVYPLIKEYIRTERSIDQNFVNKYLSLYDTFFSAWPNELDHLLAYRYVVANSRDEIKSLRSIYPTAYVYKSKIPLNQASLEEGKQTPLTKVIIISSDHTSKVKEVKKVFPELNYVNEKSVAEFVHVTTLKDKTKLILVSRRATQLADLLQTSNKDRKVKAADKPKKRL